MNLPLLTIIVFLPLLGAVTVALLGNARATAGRAIAATVSVVDLVLVAWMTMRFDVSAGMQFVEKVAWVPQANMTYHLGLDGMSLTMVVLSALLTLLAIVASWKTGKNPALWFSMLLLLEVGMNGVFLAMDFVLFYVFWELVLVPMYFLIAMWGGPRRQYAAVKFFLYTLFGSVFMLVGIIALYLQTGTFDILEMAGAGLDPSFQWWVFGAFFLGFAVKVPIFPLHTWLPDAHVEAPTAASVLLAGVLLKMGSYGFLRISLPILPDAAAEWSTFIAALAAISIVYGAAVAFAQTDMKKLVAYSSVSHMGFVMLGIASMTPEGLNGAVAVMFSHGIVTGMLFFLVGMVYDRTHTRVIAEVSGLSSKVPIAGGLFAFASFASLGLPGLSGFVGEFLSLLGAWASDIPVGWVIVSAIGVLLAAAYMLWLVQRVVLGSPSAAVESIPDLSTREVLVLVPLVMLTIGVGVYWDSLLRFTDPAVRSILAMMGGA
ncbi:MAG: NADH-quinone oxidoreductase subunit M [Coriobacteriia bacterium]|nr:NADH-quinone oxidoreductase subunit M [Coriobacteriia bacterium]